MEPEYTEKLDLPNKIPMKKKVYREKQFDNEKLIQFLEGTYFTSRENNKKDKSKTNK